jgi:hypothetical protein
MLTYIEYTRTIKKKLLTPRPGHTHDYHRMAMYQCECGKEFEARINNVKSGNTNSCGCKRSPVNIASFQERTHNTLAWTKLLVNGLTARDRQIKQTVSRPSILDRI